MQIGVIGATGTIGSRVVSEALSRGHRITAFSRDASQMEDSRENVSWETVDVLDAAGIAAVLPGLDVLISGFGPGNAAKDEADSVARSIADPTAYARAATALLTALDSHPRTRLIVIGGAASLEVKPGLAFTDSSELLNEALDQFGLPREYAAAMRGHGDALNVLRTSNRLWTYFSPAVETAPGERTGRYRIGGPQPVMDAAGRDRISLADDAADPVAATRTPTCSPPPAAALNGETYMSQASAAPAASQSGKQIHRWRAFAVLAVSVFMTIADLTIVNVALPTIGRKLHMPESSLQWVVTGYGLTFGGFLLLGGRAADLLGRRRILMAGLFVFTAASLGCGLSTPHGFLIPLPFLQALGAPIVLPAALSIVMNMFPEGAERNKALGAWGAIGASGAAVGGM